MFVELKEIQVKYNSICPKLLAQIYATLAKHTDFIFGPHLVPPRYSDDKL